jgi:ammonium transporter Rh
MVHASSHKLAVGDTHFIGLIVAVQLVFFIIFGIWGAYHNDALPNRLAVVRNVSLVPAPVAPIRGQPAARVVQPVGDVYGQQWTLVPVDTQNGFTAKYPVFVDTNAALLAGFGFLVVFLRRYGFGAISMNLLLAAFTVEWAVIIRGFLSNNFAQHSVFTVGLNELIYADFTVAAILISFGALVGKLSPVQYLLMAIIETPIAILVEHLLLNTLQIADLGGSIFIHVFGAFFGIAVSRILYDARWQDHEHDGSVYHSDLFSLIGTMFLWIFFPSLNASRANFEDMRHRAVLNTYLALVASTIYAFIFSPIFNKNRRFIIRDISHASLAGAIAIAAVSHTVLSPVWALLIGSLAGTLSVLSFRHITPRLAKSANVHDSRGVLSLHGLPGILGGVLSILVLFFHSQEAYGDNLHSIYPAMRLTDNNGRDRGTQALLQLAGLGLALLIAVISGAIVGFLLRLKFWNHVRDSEVFSDTQFFEVPEDFDFATRITSRVTRIELAETQGMLNPVAETAAITTTSVHTGPAGGGVITGSPRGTANY